jgi:HEAT repeat protein
MKKAITFAGAWLLAVASTAPLGSQAQQEPKSSAGREAIKALAEEFEVKRKNATTRKEQVEAIQLATDAIDELRHGNVIMPGLSRFAGDRDMDIRRHALPPMAKIGGAYAASVPTIALGLFDSEIDENKLVGIQALHYVWPYKPAIPALTKLAKDKSPKVRAAAVGLLGAYGRYFGEAIAPVIAALDDNATYDGDVTVRLVALGGLGQIGPDAKEAVPRIVKLIEAEKWFPEKRVMTAAQCRIAPGEPILVSTAKEWLRETYSTRIAALGLAAAIGKDAKPLVPDIVALLKERGTETASKNAHIKTSALQTLAALGPAAKEALPAIEALADTGDRLMREQVQKTIKAIKGN